MRLDATRRLVEALAAYLATRPLLGSSLTTQVRREILTPSI